MRGSVTVEIKRNDFGKISSQLPYKASAVVRKAAFDVLAISQPFTPVETGFLRNSAAVEVLSDMEAIVYWAALYAKFQEFGTRYIAPKLFATRAAEQVRPEFVAAMKQMLLELAS